MIEEPVKATYFATLDKGKIATLGEAYPPHELIDCQILLTREEYDLLKALKVSLKEAKRVIRAVEAKIKSNGS